MPLYLFWHSPLYDFSNKYSVPHFHVAVSISIFWEFIPAMFKIVYNITIGHLLMFLAMSYVPIICSTCQLLTSFGCNILLCQTFANLNWWHHWNVYLNLKLHIFFTFFGHMRYKYANCTKSKWVGFQGPVFRRHKLRRAYSQEQYIHVKVVVFSCQRSVYQCTSYLL